MENKTHKQYIEEQITTMLEENLERIQNYLIKYYLPENIEAGTPDYQIWNSEMNNEILDELKKQVEEITEEG
jgi:hypothetical protein